MGSVNWPDVHTLWMSLLTDMQIVFLTCITFLLNWAVIIDRLFFGALLMVCGGVLCCLEWCHEWLNGILTNKLALKLVLSMGHDACGECEGCRARAAVHPKTASGPLVVYKKPSNGNVVITTKTEKLSVTESVATLKTNVMQLIEMPELLEPDEAGKEEVVPKSNVPELMASNGRKKKSDGRRRR
ncbi:uncharacterized protein LOC129593880 [Paramacrobiotus metropolitanus]|uniref:uncharacterized protein LOC129593880 n=1 Tax=Paramacrobiotus metropolitanus TaxID=2943436 RepID=UPI0024465495|nr:uncharacterized protein LOC129593880 [Paramacrobiotus metropolitanus]XP_055346349.1 uncharacterized protein LOC129593880 [Paramacrobiotus metropolitanus]